MIRSALIVAPNAGVSLGYGGGCKVAVEMAEVLLESNVEVGLTAFHGFPLEDLDRIHNTNLKGFGGKIRTHYFLGFGFTNKNLMDGLFSFLPTYVGVLPLIITKYIKRVLCAFNPSLVIFHDDLPMNVKDLLGGRKSILYAHFPMAARLKLGNPEEREEEQFLKKGIELFLKPFLKHAIVMVNPPCEVLLANSTITKNYMKTMWSRDDVTVLYPPVDTRLYKPSWPKEDLIVSIGPIQSNKRFGDVIKVLNKVKIGCKYVIIGHVRENHYYNHLMNSIARAELKGRVIIKPNASRDYIINVLSRAKILVHAARFEPFGIAVVEGMASGCVPIVYKGARSGPWLDIIKEGEFGLGFQTTEELAKNIERVITNEKFNRYYSNKAVARAQDFDSQVFKKRFVTILRNL